MTEIEDFPQSHRKNERASQTVETVTTILAFIPPTFFEIIVDWTQIFPSHQNFLSREKIRFSLFSDTEVVTSLPLGLPDCLTVFGLALLSHSHPCLRLSICSIWNALCVMCLFVSLRLEHSQTITTPNISRHCRVATMLQTQYCCWEDSDQQTRWQEAQALSQPRRSVLKNTSFSRGSKDTIYQKSGVYFDYHYF